MAIRSLRLQDLSSRLNLSSISHRASSFKKAALDRLLSFTSTGNNADPEDPQPQVAIEMETLQPPASSIPHADAESTTELELQDFRRTASGVALAVLGFSFTLMVNKLPSAEDHILLVSAQNSAVLISFFLGGFLLLSSLRTDSSSGMRILQEKVMNLSVIFTCVSFLLRSFSVSPTKSLPLEYLFFVVFLGAVIIYLRLTSRLH